MIELVSIEWSIGMTHVQRSKINTRGINEYSGWTRHPGPGIQEQASGPGIRDQVSGTRHPGPSIRDQVSGTRHPGPGIRDQVSGTRHPRPGIRDQASGTRYPTFFHVRPDVKFKIHSSSSCIQEVMMCYNADLIACYLFG